MLYFVAFLQLLIQVLGDARPVSLTVTDGASLYLTKSNQNIEHGKCSPIPYRLDPDNPVTFNCAASDPIFGPGPEGFVQYTGNSTTCTIHWNHPFGSGASTYTCFCVGEASYPCACSQVGFTASAGSCQGTGHSQEIMFTISSALVQ
eukprot:TRINITY_DN22293_c0_g1_i1.p1 TRINITY_DN22293_c0_g1~~TRINITY_DN22293_c0_g1_i1.p1  ORF type:complete len:147 (-),score=9.89 TRINITY_DN22293_c0_g1_i1:39-479(-)